MLLDTDTRGKHVPVHISSETFEMQSYAYGVINFFVFRWNKTTNRQLIKKERKKGNIEIYTFTLRINKKRKILLDMQN